MIWLEPLVEVVTAAGRVAYGPVTADGCCRRCSRPAFCKGATPLRLGLTEDDPVFQQSAAADVRARRRDRSGQPRRLRGARRLRGLRARLDMAPAEIVAGGHGSGLRGRGGAAFPDRHQMEDGARCSRPTQKYVTCNADEGDSGTFADRMLMEGDPFVLIEGMTIAGIAVGATRGLHLSACRISARAPRAERGDRDARTRRLSRCRCPGQRQARSTSKCASARAPTSAAKRPRCSKASRASAARCACVRRCPPSRACSASRRSSTT